MWGWSISVIGSIYTKILLLRNSTLQPSQSGEISFDVSIDVHKRNSNESTMDCKAGEKDLLRNQ